jgi:hypothetical protein
LIREGDNAECLLSRVSTVSTTKRRNIFISLPNLFINFHTANFPHNLSSSSSIPKLPSTSYQKALPLQCHLIPLEFACRLNLQFYFIPTSFSRAMIYVPFPIPRLSQERRMTYAWDFQQFRPCLSARYFYVSSAGFGNAKITSLLCLCTKNLLSTMWAVIDGSMLAVKSFGRVFFFGGMREVSSV